MRNPLRDLTLAIFFLLISVSSTILLHTPLGPLNSVAKILNPINGVWRRQPDTIAPNPSSLQLAGLCQKVSLVIDSNQVSHLFATTDEDLYFAQGYVTAHERLWQMEFLARLASGRLSEVLGSKTRIVDETFVKLGIPQAARDSWELMRHDARTEVALSAYARGVNAYIRTLTEKDLPFEYKLFGVVPEQWQPLNSVLITKFMAFMLAGHSQDLKLTRSRSRLSDPDFQKLFPLIQPGAESIVVDSAANWPFKNLAPEAPQELFRSTIDVTPLGPQPSPNNGSNNWAVAGKKSTTGLPILSNDIHLDYGLPALWYHIQLLSPEQNVMGASLPGTPGVVLGFNKNTAWAVTNGGTDVMDWYELRYRDELQLEYLHAGEWRPIITREHELKIRGEPSAVLKLKQTHFGPIPFEEQDRPLLSSLAKGLALRWAVLDPSNEIKVFLDLNHAKNFAECSAAIAGHSTPDQNFICVDNQDHIGIFHQGKYPIRFSQQGRVVSDGSDPAYDWKGWIPENQLPKLIDPAQGFVGSANQEPVGAKYPHPLIGFHGGQFELPFRSSRIYQLLRAKDRLSPDDFMQMQADSRNGLAAELRDQFVTVSRDLQNLGSLKQQMITVLQKWDLRNEPDSTAATIWEAWWQEFEVSIWSDKFPNRERFLYPSEAVTASLIRDEPDSIWYDRRGTEKVESFSDLLDESLERAASRLSAQLGQDVAAWTWSRFQPLKIDHMTKLPGLGSATIPTRGSYVSVMANSGRHGPSWSVIVQLDRARPKAWSIQPGGQSGDPRSRYYDNLLHDWSQTILRPMNYYLDFSETGGATNSLEFENSILHRLELLPENHGTRSSAPHSEEEASK